MYKPAIVIWPVQAIVVQFPGGLDGSLEWHCKLFPTPEYSSKQPSDPVVPLVPCTGIFLGPSKSGKTVTLISLILEQYRGVFERIYIFSPSIDIDDGCWDEWDEAALRRIIQQQRKITEASKKLERMCLSSTDPTAPWIRCSSGAVICRSAPG